MGVRNCLLHKFIRGQKHLHRLSSAPICEPSARLADVQTQPETNASHSAQYPPLWILHPSSLPCLLCLRCLRDTCIPEDALLKDPRRLYAPGRIYHIVERKMFRCGRYPPVVKTAVPVDGRFEHVVLSCNATMDHAVIWIEREAQKALDRMLEKESVMDVPSDQRMERDETVQREHVEEHRAALRRAVTLSVPDAHSPPSTYGTFGGGREWPEKSESFPSLATARARQQRVSWNDLIERVFDKDEDGQIVLRSSPPP